MKQDALLKAYYSPSPELPFFWYIYISDNEDNYDYDYVLCHSLLLCVSVQGS